MKIEVGTKEDHGGSKLNVENDFCLFNELTENNYSDLISTNYNSCKNSEPILKNIEENNYSEFCLFNEKSFEDNSFRREKSSELSLFEFGNTNFNVEDKKQMEIMESYLNFGEADLKILLINNKESSINLYQDLSVRMTTSIEKASQYTEFVNQNYLVSTLIENEEKNSKIGKKFDFSKILRVEEFKSSINFKHLSIHDKRKNSSKNVIVNSKEIQDFDYEIKKYEGFKKKSNKIEVNDKPSPLINFVQRVINPNDIKNMNLSKEISCGLCHLNFASGDIVVYLECNDKFHRECLLNVQPEICFACNKKINYSS